MDCIERFNHRMQIAGNSIRNERLHNNKNLIEEVFKDDVAYDDKVSFWELGKTIKQIKQETIGLRLYSRKFSAANGTTMQFQSLLETPIDIGDIIYIHRTDEFWICTESFNVDEVHFEGEFTKCNWMLKWQNKAGRILEYPTYIINSTQYNSGETLGKIITIGSTQHQITIPCDENTVSIQSPQRFILSKDPVQPDVYVVTQNDSVTYNYGNKGLCKITVLQDVLKDTDRIDLGICDYVEPTNDTHDSEADTPLYYNAKIVYKKNILKSGGSVQTFTAQFTDNKGKPVKRQAKWEIISNFKKYIKASYKDNEIMLSIDNDDYIDEEFKLVLNDSLGLCNQDEVIIKVESLL